MTDNKRNKLTALYVVKVKPDKVESVVTEVMQMLPIARRQRANITLDVHQDTTDPTRLMIYENWVSEEELNQWVATPEMKAYFQKLTPMFAGEPEITHWQMISEDASDAEYSTK